VFRNKPRTIDLTTENKGKVEMMIRRISRAILVAVFVCAVTSCSQNDGRIGSAVAVLHPSAGSSVQGVVRFEQQPEQVVIRVELSGLKPNAIHGFHIHEFGDCRAADASSAGGHYSPRDTKHGDPKDPFHHAGDLGNLRTDGEGRVETRLFADYITINGKKNPVLGRAVIVHEKADDLLSQPSGAAGDRWACGVIGVANPDYEE